MTTEAEWKALFDQVREAWKQASAGFFVQGMSQAQIDALAGIAINTIRTREIARLQAEVKRLRSVLTDIDQMTRAVVGPESVRPVRYPSSAGSIPAPSTGAEGSCSGQTTSSVNDVAPQPPTDAIGPLSAAADA